MPICTPFFGLQKNCLRLVFVFLLTLSPLFSTPIWAQSAGRNTVGAAAYGLGGAAATVGNPYAIFQNIGALAEVNSYQGFVGYENYFAIAGWHTLFAGATLPFVRQGKPAGTAGIGVWRFGDDLYSEQRLALGYSHKIEGVSLGVQANYLQVQAEGVGVRRVIVIEFGGVARLTETIFVGLHGYNLNLAKMATFEDERFPTILKAGLSYRPHSRLMVNLEAEKDVLYPVRLRAGLEYAVWAERVWLRLGATSRPFANYFGLGYRQGRFRFDYALSTQPQIGFSNHLSVCFQFSQKTFAAATPAEPPH
jgi:hypothetical protein